MTDDAAVGGCNPVLPAVPLAAPATSGTGGSAPAASLHPVEVRNLTKRFKDITAIRDLSFTVERGQICALVGPNGAGKSTTMRVLATLSRPTSGTAMIEGLDCWRQMRLVRTKMGYMPDRYGLYRDLPVRDYLELFAAAYGIPERDHRGLIDGLLDLTGLREVAAKAADSLSLGMRQRFFLARTLVHSPGVLILDEPAANLDPRARVELRDVLRVLKSRGVTTLISSHILTELQDVCDQVVIIEKGGLVHAGALDRALAAAREKPVVRIDLGGEAGRAVPVVEKVEGVAGVQASGDSLLVEFSGGEEVIARISSALISAGLRVERVAEDRASLEELFMRLTRGELH